MVNSNVNALGVIFANTYDNLVPELVAERSMASIPFGGRYRLIDFTLSSMANAGIDNVSVIVRKNYHSLMDHLGAGREWDLTRKRGGLNIVPPFAERSVKLYSGRVDALDSILNWLEAQKERYVILSDSYIAMNFDFNKLIDAHVKSGADVTMVYNRAAIPEGARSDNYTIRLDDNDRVVEILSNDYRIGEQNLAMNIYVIERESLIHLRPRPRLLRARHPGPQPQATERPCLPVRRLCRPRLRHEELLRREYASAPGRQHGRPVRTRAHLHEDS